MRKIKFDLLYINSQGSQITVYNGCSPVDFAVTTYYSNGELIDDEIYITIKGRPRIFVYHNPKSQYSQKYTPDQVEEKYLEEYKVIDYPKDTFKLIKMILKKESFPFHMEKRIKTGIIELKKKDCTTEIIIPRDRVKDFTINEWNTPKDGTKDIQG